MKALRRIAVLSLSVVLLLGLARKIHADGVEQVSLKISPAQEINSGAFVAQMESFGERSTSLDQEIGAFSKLTQIRALPSYNMAAYRAFLANPASLKLRPNPLYFGTWAPVSSANGRNSAIASRAETITNGLTNQETLIKQAAAHGDSRRSALFGEWTPRMNLQTVDGSETTSGGDAVIGGGGGGLGGGGGSGRGDNNGNSIVPSWIDRASLKVTDAQERRGIGGSNISIILEDAAGNKVALYKPSPAPPAINQPLTVVFSPTQDIYAEKSYQVNGSNAGEIAQLLKEVKSRQEYQRLLDGSKIAVEDFVSLLAIKFPNKEDSSQQQLRSTNEAQDKTTLQGVVTHTLLGKGSKFEHWGFVLQTPDGKKLILRRDGANPFEEDPIIKEYEGQDVVVRGQTDGEYFYVSVIEHLVWTNLPPPGPQIAAEDSIADGGERTYSRFTPVSIEQRISPPIDGGSIVLKGNLGKGRDVTIYSDYALNSQTHGQFFVTTNFFNSIQPQRKMTVPELKGLSQAIGRILRATKWIPGAPEPALYTELLSRIDRAINEGQVSPETKTKILGAFQTLRAKGFSGIQWQSLPPTGVRFLKISLQKNFIPDGYQYDALIPIGVLSPNAPIQDPNLAGYFLIVKSGGLSGKSEYSGPVSLDQVTPETKAKILGTFNDLATKGFPGVEWHTLPPLGERFIEVDFIGTSIPDSTQYTALLPIGGFAQNAPTQDPNKAEYFILKQFGGLATKMPLYSGAIHFLKPQ